MQDRSAPKNSPAATTTVVEPGTHSTQAAQPVLHGEGPRTNILEERASITELLSKKLYALMTPADAAKELGKQSGKEAPPSLSSAVEDSSAMMPEPKGFFERLREQSSKLFQIHSVKELFAWAKETITGLLESAEFSLRGLRPRGQGFESSPTTSHASTMDSPASTTHGFTPTPTILEPSKELDAGKTHVVDYTAEGLFAVGEATRKEAEAKEQKAKHLLADTGDHKRQVRAEVLAIDARVGGENPELQAIINQLDGVYGSIEVALRNIMEAQAKEMGSARKKAA